MFSFENQFEYVDSKKTLEKSSSYYSLNGQLAIEHSKISSGISGTVSAFRDFPNTDRYTAIKKIMLTQEEIKNPEILDCKLRKAQREAKFNARYGGLGKVAYVDGTIYLLMEYLSHDLETLLLKEEPKKSFKDKNAFLSYFIQIAHALKELHKLKIVHLDVKPSNICETNSDLIRLCDFGVAKYFGEKVTGTWDPEKTWHCAPESKDSYADPSMDVYSLGILLATFNESSNDPVIKNKVLDCPKLFALYKGMTCKSPRKRPSLDKVIATCQSIIDSNKKLSPISPRSVVPFSFLSRRYAYQVASQNTNYAMVPKNSQ